MPINPETVKAFLERDVEPLPAFRGAKRGWLLKVIEDAAGTPYEPIGFEPYPEQLEGLACALYAESCLLFLDMQLGKSKVAADWMQHLKRGGRWKKGKALVIAHSAEGVRDWCKKGASQSHLTFEGITSGKGSMDRLLAACTNPAVDVVVVAWGLLQALLSDRRKMQRKDKMKQYVDEAACDDLAAFFRVAVIDEIHMCQNHYSVRFQIASRLVARCRFRLGLTGTPSGRDPLAVWAQTYLIDDGELLGRSFHFFAACFCKKEQVWRPGRGLVERQVFDKKKQPLLTEWLRSISIQAENKRRRITYQIVRLHMKGDQARAYDELLERREKAKYDMESKDRANFFTGLRQISAGFQKFVDEDGKERVYCFTENAKIEWLRALAAEMPAGMQWMIYHEYVPSGTMICAALDELGVSYGWVYGGKTATQRKDTISAFERGEFDVLVSNATVGAMSLSFPNVDYILFYDAPTNPKLRAQCENRPAARGEKPWDVDDLVASPVDERVMELGREGKVTLAKLLGRNMPRRRFFDLLRR